MAGDVFDRWNAPPEIINAAVRHMPHVFGVPGNHDLPNHSLDEIHRSAYWTLVETGKLTTLRPKDGIPISDRDGQVTAVAWGYAHGVECRPIENHMRYLKIAVVHRYMWVPGAGYKDAPEEGRVYDWHDDKFRGYDVVVVGDNHKYWSVHLKGQVIWNCGSLMRRHSDEIGHRPRVGIIDSNGTVREHLLDTSGDRFVEVPPGLREVGIDPDALLKDLKKLTNSTVSFPDAVHHYLRTHKVTPQAKSLLVEWAFKQSLKRELDREA